MLQLSELHDPRFDDFAKSMSTSTIIASLTAKGIYDLEHNILDIEKIGKAAKTDEMIVLFDLYYTQTEAEVHALASIVMNKFARDNGIEPAEAYREYVEILPKVDLMAGDLRGFRTSTGLNECVEACETNEKCKAFTFAKYTHPNDKKKNMCWLKKEKFIYSTSGKEHYVSGIKP